MISELNYTVILCVDYDENVLRRYNQLFKSSEIQGGSTQNYGSLYISTRNLHITNHCAIQYNLILALGADDAKDIASRIYRDGGTIAVAFFDIQSSSDDMLQAIGTLRERFPFLICAVAVHGEVQDDIDPQDLFISPSEWLYYQSKNTAEQIEQLIAHLISSFVLHREKERALAKNEATREGLREILDASPDLLKNQSDQQLIAKILESLTKLTDTQNAFLMICSKDGEFQFVGGIGQFQNYEGYINHECGGNTDLFLEILEDKKIARRSFGLLAPLLMQDKKVGILFFDKERQQTQDTELLDVFAHHVAFAIENHRLQREIEKKQALEHELNLASKIQDNLLPKSFPEVKNLQLYGATKSAKEIGGDYFDVIEAGDNIYFCIGDVSGKGLPAGLIMTELRSIVRSFACVHTSPKEILLRSAELILKDIAGSGKFVSMLLLQWDGDKFLYSSAGHEHILHFHAATGECDAYRSGGVVLGVDFRNFSRLTKEKELVLEKDDLVVLFTDGATEAHNSQGDMFKLTTLQERVKKYHHLPIQEMMESIMKEVDDFIGEAEQHDDITLLGFRYTP